jgi:peptidoglycan-associated lipoprotein
MFRKSLVLVLPLFVLAACSSTSRQEEAPPAEVAPPPAAVATPDDADAVASAGTVGELNARSVTLPPELADRRIIYFAFDSDAISAEDQAVIAAHARFMAGRAGVRVRLEGHTDQRGSREYNVGLGERRAQAVRRALGLQGVAEARLSTVSYGEEQPAVGGEDEAAYARNRRVELVYTAE